MELTLPVTLAVLGGALLHATWNALVKASADKQLDAISNSVGAGVLSIGVLFLGEKMTRRRLVATGAVLAGLGVLKL